VPPGTVHALSALCFKTLLGKVPAEGQHGVVIRYSDGNNLAISRLDGDPAADSATIFVVWCLIC
jgi:hypothetical protein